MNEPSVLNGKIVARYRVKRGRRVDLRRWDPADSSAFDGTKEEGEARLPALEERLGQLQDLLYAEHARSLLVVLQAMDTGGKDGTIRRVFHGMDPQGLRVAAFKVPTPEERDHDFLWRVHKQAPGKGEIVVFNRSHYEDVLVPRVHGLISAEECLDRYERIRAFEELLDSEGTAIVKFFLHISPEEQKRRLRARLADPAKNWKYSPGDLVERRLWNSYMEAYQDALAATSARRAPWYIVPADRKWYRNLVVARILIERLESLDMRYPKAPAR